MNYERALDSCETLFLGNVATKHPIEGYTFFIIPTGEKYKVMKFYDGGIDYREAGGFESPSEAYSMAITAL